MTSYEEILRKTVSGQIRSYLHDHPEIFPDVPPLYTPGRRKKVKERKSFEAAFVQSLTKRIIGDLGCTETRVRLITAGFGSLCSRSVE